MAKLSDNFGFEIPEPMDMVNREYFARLVVDIDAKVAGDKDLEEIMKLTDQAIRVLDAKIEDSANDYNILTSDTFDGSQPVLSSYLANVKKAINDLRKQIIHELRAEDVKTRGSIAGAPYANVQSALEALDKAVKGLKSTDIKHGTSTVSKAISDLDSRIDNISGQVGGEVKASSVKTDRGYQGSSRNVESALSSISGKVDGHNSKISTNERDIQSMKSDISRNKSDISRNKGSITTLEDKVAKLQSGSEVPLTSDIIRHSSRNIKATNVQDALEELFTYADDTHAKWASSVGSPLSKSDSAAVKERKTKELISELNQATTFKGVKSNQPTLKKATELVYDITPKTIHDTYLNNSKSYTLNTYDPDGFSGRGLMVLGKLKATDIVHSFMVGNVGTSDIFNVNIVPKQFNGYSEIPIEGKTSFDSYVKFIDKDTVDFRLFYKQGQVDKLFRLLYFGELVTQPSYKRVPRNASDPQADKMWEDFKKEHGYT